MVFPAGDKPNPLKFKVSSGPRHIASVNGSFH